MNHAGLGKGIVIKVANEIGVLNQISKLVAEKGVNVIAVHGTVNGGVATLRVITTDNLHVGDALRARNYEPHETDCVLVEVPNKPGVLRHVTEKLRGEAIDIHHLYATAAEASESSVVVFATSHNDRAIVVLNKWSAPSREPVGHAVVSPKTTGTAMQRLKADRRNRHACRPQEQRGDDRVREPVRLRHERRHSQSLGLLATARYRGHGRRTAVPNCDRLVARRQRGVPA